jgi:SAM-dependent methyltransferase
MKFWNNTVIRIPGDSFFKKIKINPDIYSVLAKGVYFANYNFSKELRKTDVVLEIGCGSDSIIYDNHKGAWFGIDVVMSDRHNKPTLATDIASVHSMPYNNNKFDFVISNQSIEHWYEYGISFEIAFQEINRVLKKEASFVFNFPIHLHGHKFFVLNNLKKLDNILEKNGFQIIKKTAFIGEEKYKGWIKCGFPTIYLMLFSRNFENTSFVVEYEAKKVEGFNKTKPFSSKLPFRKSRYFLRIHHGLIVFLYNILKKIKL